MFFTMTHEGVLSSAQSKLITSGLGMG